MANVFDELDKDTDESWKTARQAVLVGFTLQENKDTKKNALDTFTNEDVYASQKRTFEFILSDIKSALNVGKKPKREDFINAIKQVEDIKKVLGDAAGKTTLHPNLIGLLVNYTGEALTALEKVLQTQYKQQ